MPARCARQMIASANIEHDFNDTLKMACKLDMTISLAKQTLSLRSPFFRCRLSDEQVDAANISINGTHRASQNQSGTAAAKFVSDLLE